MTPFPTSSWRNSSPANTAYPTCSFRGADPTGDRRSAASLRAAVGALAADLEALSGAGRPGEHALRWTAFLRRWWRPSPDRAQLIGTLEGWGGPELGPELEASTALAELRDALDGAAALSGTLTDRAIRVATPMALLGGAFDVVVATGLTEGRLPAAPTRIPCCRTRCSRPSPNSKG